MKTLRLGLIGGNIKESRSPALQIACGLSAGRNVTYDLLIPDELGLSFEATLRRCAAAGFDGVNVTYPYKEEVLKYVKAAEPVVAALGASNTIKFSKSGAHAYNTDNTGFAAAYRAKWGGVSPGRVLLIGTGGVGRAIAFALADLGAAEILLHDTDREKADALRQAISDYSRVSVILADSLQDPSGLDGLINATPLGMTGREGSPLRKDFAGHPRWAFDAVYTPEYTIFRAQMEALGAEFLSGYELYFYQGIQAFRIFSGVDPDADWVRTTLRGP
ncbi:MAG: shikimate dehydrogenase [Rhizobiales bacterium]|nr:shikimate dehydrogenase [Hyphomicrobiales bacterium]